MHVDFGDRFGDKQVYFPLRSVIVPVIREQDGWLRIRDFDDREGWVNKMTSCRFPKRRPISRR